MPSVLVLFAHPALRKSRVHRALVAAARAVRGVTVHDLYEAYPDYDVDVAAEQALLAAHDVLVLQFPLYWYSVPPLLKQWFDLVLEHGWAYGSRGHALDGKRVQVAVSAGGRAEAYAAEGFNRASLAQFLLPIEATARLCRMRWDEPFTVMGTHLMQEADITAAADAYVARLEALVAGAPVATVED